MLRNVRAWGVGGALTLAAAEASAAIPTAVTDAFTALDADLIVVGGLVVVATLGVAVWKFVQAIII